MRFCGGKVAFLSVLLCYFLCWAYSDKYCEWIVIVLYPPFLFCVMRGMGFRAHDVLFWYTKTLFKTTGSAYSWKIILIDFSFLPLRKNWLIPIINLGNFILWRRIIMWPNFIVYFITIEVINYSKRGVHLGEMCYNY
jgi:hypothetical protein